MEKRQTAVEWLVEQLSDEFSNYPDAIIEQAQQMEKEQSLKMLPYDLDELVEEIYPICNLGLNATTSLHTLHQESYKAGFQKALELLTFKSE